MKKELDPNMVVENKIGESDCLFYDVRQDPFTVYGLFRYREEPQFKRLPDDVAKKVNPGVATLYLHTAGGRVRFCTDSQYVAIRAVMPSVYRISNMSLSGVAGFDLYIDDPETGISRYHRLFMPDYDMNGGYEAKVKFASRQLRHFTIHFPSYAEVKDLFIGLQSDAFVGEGVKYRDIPPMVYYGSSITQGASSSRPGNIYQNMISRQTHVDYINLGFAGSGKAEDGMVRYMAGLPMSAFISDYDHNAPSREYLASTHCKMYCAIRNSHPGIPYIMLSQPDMDSDTYEKNIDRRNIIMDTYRYARGQGDRNVYYIDGESIFRGSYEDSCVVDGIHPNDLGFSRMAEVLLATLKRAWTQAFISN